MKKPQKYYRICQINDGKISLFETQQFGEPNNWFESIGEIDSWLAENFVDAHPGEGNQIAVIALPVWVLGFKAV